MKHRIMCIDMDAFYVSCEQAFKPYLKKKPLAVGGAYERGVVCTCSYELMQILQILIWKLSF